MQRKIVLGMGLGKVAVAIRSWKLAVVPTGRFLGIGI